MKKLEYVAICLLLTAGCGKNVEIKKTGSISLVPDAPNHIPYSELDDTGLILVDVIFDGRKPLKFLFDTGASQTVIFASPRTIELNLPFKKPSESDSSDRIEWIPIEGKTIEIGDVRIDNLTVFCAHWSNFPFFKNESTVWCDGVIGYDFLKSIPVVIDRSSRTIKFYQEEDFVPPSDWGEIRLDVEDLKPYCDATIKIQSDDSAVSVRLHLDSGMAAYLALISNLDKKIYVPQGAISGDGWMNGQAVSGSAARIEELSFLGGRFSNVLTSFPVAGHSAKGNRDGSIGSLILKEYDLFIDFPGRRLAGLYSESNE